jgi:glycosyltransferase involved in cell wall biosynthesis
MLRVTQLVSSPSRVAHGNAASRLALGLAQAGLADPTILCYGNDPAPSWLPSEVHVERLGVDRATRAVLPLAHYLRTRRPDVLITRQVHANFIGLAAAALARVRHGWEGKHVLVQAHPIELSHAANWQDNKWAAKALYRFADGIISPSPAVREDIIRWCGLAPESAAVVPNGTSPFVGKAATPPHPWLRPGEPPVFVQTSNMTPWKRLDLLIDAFAEVRKAHEARLLILGAGGGSAQATEQINRLGLVNDAQLTGWVEDPLQYAAWAHAFVLTSDEEGFAQVLTEAMGVGCPVITTDAQGGGPRFVTDEGRSGILVPMGDRTALADAMRRMLSDEVRQHYSEAGKKRADELSPEACAVMLKNFLVGHVGAASSH